MKHLQKTSMLTRPEPAPWMRIDELCQYLGGITKRTAYAWMANRKLPVGRRLGGGRTIVYSRSAVEAWIESQPLSDAGHHGKTGLTRSEYARQQVASASFRADCGVAA